MLLIRFLADWILLHKFFILRHLHPFMKIKFLLTYLINFDSPFEFVIYVRQVALQIIIMEQTHNVESSIQDS